MALPTDIVPIFYSGSVNIGSNNSQSLASSLTPILTQVSNTDKRLWQKFDRVFAFLPNGLLETTNIVGNLVRKITRKITTETTSISEAIARAMTLTETTNIIEGSGYTSGYYSGYEVIPGLLRKFIPRMSTQSVSISDSIGRPHIKEIVSIAESISRKIIRNLTIETMSISERLFGAEFAGLTENISISESISRLLKANRVVIEGECSLLFNGLD